MRKTLLTSLCFCLLVAFAQKALCNEPLKSSKIIGSPKNKNWVAKIEEAGSYNDEIFTGLSFSEDGGKSFYPVELTGYTPNLVVWSPDGQYLLFFGKCDIGMDDAPFLEKGLWHHYPGLYDPAKRVFFGAPKASKGRQVLGAGWDEKSKSTITIGSYAESDISDGCVYEGTPFSTSKITTKEWEQKSENVSIDPYANWLGIKLVSLIEKKKFDAIPATLKGAASQKDIDRLVRFISKEVKGQRPQKVQIEGIKTENDLDFLKKGERNLLILVPFDRYYLYLSFDIRLSEKRLPQIFDMRIVDQRFEAYKKY